MTNEELQQLKELAKNLAQTLRPMMLDGDGAFVRLCESGIDVETIPASEVLRMVTHGGRKADALFAKLDAIPTRKVAVKPKLIEHQAAE